MTKLNMWVERCADAATIAMLASLPLGAIAFLANSF